MLDMEERKIIKFKEEFDRFLEKENQNISNLQEYTKEKVNNTIDFKLLEVIKSYD
jgi:tRNA U34 5-carboxymethylaminomethyl modifying enzyme MnmG/GidA